VLLSHGLSRLASHKDCKPAGYSANGGIWRLMNCVLAGIVGASVVGVTGYITTLEEFGSNCSLNGTLMRFTTQ